ncbi:MAG: hypothetical protein RMZ69_03605 [Nostoc sp. ChiQUE01a]|nr:hypothetical protein [Nostoc sp. ChiQUE01a]
MVNRLSFTADKRGMVRCAISQLSTAKEEKTDRLEEKNTIYSSQPIR